MVHGERLPVLWGINTRKHVLQNETDVTKKRHLKTNPHTTDMYSISTCFLYNYTGFSINNQEGHTSI